MHVFEQEMRICVVFSFALSLTLLILSLSMLASFHQCCCCWCWWYFFSSSFCSLLLLFFVSFYICETIHVVMRRFMLLCLYTVHISEGQFAINVCDSVLHTHSRTHTQKNGHFIHYARYINLNFILFSIVVIVVLKAAFVLAMASFNMSVLYST